MILCTVCGIKKTTNVMLQRSINNGEGECLSCYRTTRNELGERKIPRECLKCSKDFTADNKYIRTCPSCKGSHVIESYDMWE